MIVHTALWYSLSFDTFSCEPTLPSTLFQECCVRSIMPVTGSAGCQGGPSITWAAYGIMSSRTRVEEFDPTYTLQLPIASYACWLTPFTEENYRMYWLSSSFEFTVTLYWNSFCFCTIYSVVLDSVHVAYEAIGAWIGLSYVRAWLTCTYTCKVQYVCIRVQYVFLVQFKQYGRYVSISLCTLYYECRVISIY